MFETGCGRVGDVDVSGRLFRDHAPRWRRGRRRRRDHECDPRIPAIGPVLRGKFLVAFEIEVALHLADGKNESELRAVLTAVIS